MPKKRKKWERDIARAQAISGSSKTEVTREQWWDMLHKAQSYADITNVVLNFDCPSAYKDLELKKEGGDGKEND